MVAPAISKPEELRDRTKKFAYRVLRAYQQLPHRFDAQHAGKQLLRCATSVAANYRAVCRARSKAEFVAKLGVVSEECDEAVFWIELLVENNVVSLRKFSELLSEARQLSAIFTASLETVRGNR